MIPKGPSLEHVWDGLLAWKAERDRRRHVDDDRELKRKVVLGADALVNAALKGFFRGVAIAIGILALLYVLAQFGHH